MTPLVWMVVLGCFCVVSVAFGAETYYVDPNATQCPGCNDSNSCAQAQTLSTGFDTINKCITCMSAAGTDRCELRGGNYPERIDSNIVPIAAGTTWANANTIARYQLEVPVLGVGVDTVGSIINLPLATDAYIIFDGITVNASLARHAVSVGSSGAHHIRFKNCDMHSSRGYSTSGEPYHGGQVIQFMGTFHEFLNSKVHGSQNGYGFYSSGDDLLIEGNEIYDNAGYGVSVYLQGGGTDRAIVRNNRIYNNGFERAQPGLQLGAGTGHLAYNNLIYGNYRGANTFGGCVNCLWYNNTLYNNGDGFTCGSGTITGTVLRNNLLWQSGTVVSCGTGTVTSTNLAVSVNPFVNTAAGNFTLLAGSAPIDAGTTVAAVPVDFGGQARPQGAAYDVGAWEVGAAGPLHLVFSTPPQTAVEGVTMAVVRVQVRNSANVVQTGQTGVCTASKASGPGTFNGDLTRNAVAGVCTFDDWSMSSDGTYTIAIVYTGATGVTSGNVVITDAVTPPAVANVRYLISR